MLKSSKKVLFAGLKIFLKTFIKFYSYPLNNIIPNPPNKPFEDIDFAFKENYLNYLNFFIYKIIMRVLGKLVFFWFFLYKRKSPRI